MTDHVLTGCRSTPLLSYLKALGVARLVSRADPTVRLWWGREGFACLRATFDRDGLLAYLLDEYEPSPIASPWNGGSGFYPGDNKESIEKIEGSTHARLGTLRETIRLGRTMVAERCPDAKPEKKKKDSFIETWRASCSDEALAWLDATWALTDDGPKSNPLLGTGGNDGRMEFSKHFLERLTVCLPHLWNPAADTARSRSLLTWALFAEHETQLEEKPIGMFAPGSNGLPNSSSSSGTSSISSPWDYVLMLEGALLFGASVARQLSSTSATFPFTSQRPALVGVGMGSGDANKTRAAEMWLPLWDGPASVASIRRTLSEGRAQDGNRQSASGQDMARSVADLGTERGIGAFERIVFAERNGRSYAAVPVDHIAVQSVPSIELLRSADRWLSRARRVDADAVRTAVNAVDRVAYALSMGTAGASLSEWLRALARAEIALGGRSGIRDRSASSHVAPLSALPYDLALALEKSPEVRLARSLAAIGRKAGGLGLRSLIEPIEAQPKGGFQWADGVHGASAPALYRPLATLARLAQIDAARADTRRGDASLRDVLAFLAGQLDDRRLVELAFALTLCVPAPLPEEGVAMSASGIDRLYAVCRLATVSTAVDGREHPRPPALDVIPSLAAGQPGRALLAAMRHLRSAGRAPLESLLNVTASDGHTRRVAAALAIPIQSADLKQLERAVFAPPIALQTNHEGINP